MLTLACPGAAQSSTFTPAHTYEARAYASGPSSPHVGTSMISRASSLDFQYYRDGESVGVSDDSTGYTSRDSSVFGHSPSLFASSFESRSDAFPEHFSLDEPSFDGEVSGVGPWETTPVRRGSLPVATSQESSDSHTQNVSRSLAGTQDLHSSLGGWT